MTGRNPEKPSSELRVGVYSLQSIAASADGTVYTFLKPDGSTKSVTVPPDKTSTREVTEFLREQGVNFSWASGLTGVRQGKGRA